MLDDDSSISHPALERAAPFLGEERFGWRNRRPKWNDHAEPAATEADVGFKILSPLLAFVSSDFECASGRRRQNSRAISKPINDPTVACCELLSWHSAPRLRKARHYRSASAKYRDQWPAGPDVIAPSSRFNKYDRSERYPGAAYALASLYRSLAAAQPFVRAWWRSEAPAEGTVIVTISGIASTVRIVFRIVISIVQKSANCVFRLHKSLHSFSCLQLTWDRVLLSPLSCVLQISTGRDRPASRTGITIS
jgi:hypothetical protein